MSLVVAQLLFAVDFRFVARFSSWVWFFFGLGAAVGREIGAPCVA